MSQSQWARRAARRAAAIWQFLGIEFLRLALEIGSFFVSLARFYSETFRSTLVSLRESWTRTVRLVRKTP